MRTILTLCLLTAVVGCSREPSPVAWSPSLFSGGWIFASGDDARQYMRASEIAAAGVLTRWDAESGEGFVAVQTSLKGSTAGQTLTVKYDGGGVDAAVGDRVVVLLATRDGVLKLHSLCPASGLYRHTDDLANFVRQALAAE